MAEPIANDWMAIRDRMQQIREEESTSSMPCPRCNDRGWLPEYVSTRHAYSAGVGVCDLCHNPKDLPPPRSIPRQMIENLTGERGAAVPRVTRSRSIIIG
jgi:hypothetical protein